jgi:hypothetical protein
MPENLPVADSIKKLEKAKQSQLVLGKGKSKGNKD